MTSETRPVDSEAFCQLETALRRLIKDTLHGIDSSFDVLENRLREIEQRLPENLRPRLKIVENHVKSQEAINDSQPVAPSTPTSSRPESHALWAKVSSIDADVSSLFIKEMPILQSQIDLHQRSLEDISQKDSARLKLGPIVMDLMQRVGRLESDERAKATREMWPTDEIAEELLQRLAQGHQLASPELAAQIHLATAATTTPSTETPAQAASHAAEPLESTRKRPAQPDSSLRSDMARAADEVHDEPAPKRCRGAATTARNTCPRSKGSTTCKLDQSVDSPPPTTGAEMPEQELELTLQNQPRRSSRPHKPSRNPQYLTWLEVKAVQRRKPLV